MKKLLVVLLALVMVLGMATSAFAYTDTDNLSTVQQDAIYRLSALDVLNGYPDGTFGAANQITRAEFAKIVCVMAGLGDVTDVLKSTPSSFTDVAVGAWYTGYINVAASQGFVHGYPDGSFKPNSPITMAEVVTMLMRAAGYDDNLPGPWPFDYIAEAGKQDVTDDVTFVSNIAAKRADVAVMTNNLLDVVLVSWDADRSKFVKDADDTTLLDDSFGAAVYEVMFDNALATPDELDGWEFSDFDDNEIMLLTSEGDFVMNSDCYISAGKGLADLGGMEADIIINDDDEVIYVNLTSYVVYTDDIEGAIADEDLEVNGDEVAVADAAAGFDNDGYSYAKVFFNGDDEAYAVEDLEDADLFGGTMMIADSYDEDDEILSALAGNDLDLEDADVLVLKDGAQIEVKDIEANDVVYVFADANGADYVLIIGALVEGTLDEGSDNTITIDDKDYNFATFGAQYTTEGIDGTYAELDSLGDLDDVFGAEVQVALYANPYEVAYLASDVNAAGDSVYGIVTDITVGGLFHKVQDVTILNQEGEEVTYDVDNSDNIITFEADEDSDIELGSYVEVSLDEEGAIDGVDSILMAAEVGALADSTMTVSGSKIKINGTWYKVAEDTLFFETVTDGDGYLSANFDEANLLDVDDILDADELSADGVVIASHDGSALERVYLIDSDLNSGSESYSFVDRLYTNSDGDFVAMMDGTVAERKDGQTYSKNVFYSYDIVGGEMVVTKIFAANDANSTELDGSPFADAYWVIADGTLAEAGSDYALGNIDVVVDDVDGDTLELAGNYYTMTADTIVYVIDDAGVVDSGSDSDIEDDASILAISDEDGNLIYVFVLAAPIADLVG